MTKVRRLLLASIVPLAIAGILAVAYDWNVLWQGEVATNVLWNKQEAYVFVGRRTSGWQGNTVSWLWQVVRNYFLASTQVQSTVFSTTVLKIRADGVERIELSGRSVSPLLLAQGHIYGASPGGMVRWTGDEFVEVSVENAEAVWASSPPTPPYDDLDGWSHRSGLLNGNEGVVHMFLGGNPVALETQSLARIKRITLSLPGRPKETLLEIDEQPRYVDRRSYATAFNR